ncbi:hypothetical protein BJ508DRAFT_304201 [Ascobolus immersus RN42]|uniref:EGF-like domain-containing protein n=1 Tax=Ascobolus immersus RN42 TaxID=1160509 RepID=A0A3N4ID37_ASCIM|nr:hypothetical protein BJ508DRAFT_304201 [Ascobolus immersus RN42]
MMKSTFLSNLLLALSITVGASPVPSQIQDIPSNIPALIYNATLGGVILPKGLPGGIYLLPLDGAVYSDPSRPVYPTYVGRWNMGDVITKRHHKSSPSPSDPLEPEPGRAVCEYDRAGLTCWSHNFGCSFLHLEGQAEDVQCKCDDQLGIECEDIRTPAPRKRGRPGEGYDYPSGPGHQPAPGRPGEGYHDSPSYPGSRPPPGRPGEGYHDSPSYPGSRPPPGRPGEGIDYALIDKPGKLSKRGEVVNLPLGPGNPTRRPPTPGRPGEMNRRQSLDRDEYSVQCSGDKKLASLGDLFKEDGMYAHSVPTWVTVDPMWALVVQVDHATIIQSSSFCNRSSKQQVAPVLDIEMAMNKGREVCGKLDSGYVLTSRKDPEVSFGWQIEGQPICPTYPDM